MIARRFPWLLWLLTIGVVAVTAYLMLTEGALDVGLEPESPVQRWIQLIMSTAMGSAGTAIVTRQPRNVIGWLFVAIGLTTAAIELGISYAATCEAPATCNLAALVGFDAIWFPLIGIGLGGLFLLFPDGRIPPGWRSLLWWGLVIVGLLGGAASVVNEDVYLMAGARNPWSAGYDQRVITVLSDLVGMAVLVLAVIAIVDFVVRSRRAEGVARLQNRWLGYSGVLVVGSAIVSVTATELGIEVGWVWSLAVATLPVAVALAITRNHLYDIDRIISRTVTYTVVIALLGLLVGVVAATVGSQFGDPPVVAATTLAVAAFFNPVRRRVHSWVDRRFNRSRYDAERVINEFAGSLREQVDPDGLLEGWVGVVEETMQPASAGMWVRNGR